MGETMGNVDIWVAAIGIGVTITFTGQYSKMPKTIASTL